MSAIEEINIKSLACSIRTELSNPISEYGAIYYDPLTSLFKRIFSFRELSVNWDGNGAVALNEEVLMNARNFIKHLPYSVINALEDEDIVPTPYGTITFDWNNSKNEYVSVEIGTTSIGFFSSFEDLSNPILESTKFNELKVPNELDKALSKLLRSK